MKKNRLAAILLTGSLLLSGSVDAGRISASQILATDRQNRLRNLQEILDQILPTDDAVMLTTVSELNRLSGISGSVTATNLNTLTGGGATTLHSHAAGPSTTTLDQAYDNGQSITVDTGAGLTLTNGASQSLVIDSDTTNSTETAGVLDIDVGTTTASVNAIEIALTQDTGAGANNENAAIEITLTGDDTDGELIGMDIIAASTANSGADTYTAGIRIDNADTTTTSMTDAILITSSGVDLGVTDAIDASADNILNALNVGANTITGGAAVIDFTDFDVSADGVVTLAPDGGPADVILISPSAATTDGLDVSDVDLVNALNIGANRITSNSTATGPFEWDGVGQLVIGTGGGGGGNVGTGILTFRGGGVIDSTNDGDIQIAPQDAGLVIFPSGTTVRFPAASPEENRNGLYWDAVANTLCVDDEDGTDICNDAAGLTFSLDDAYNDGQSITVDTGAGLTLTHGASQSLVLDSDTTNSTETNGVLDINLGTTTASVNAIEIAVTQDTGAATDAENVGIEITLTGDDTDGELIGLDIIASATANAAADTYTAGIRIDNVENVTASMTDAIIITATTDAATTDAIDASDAEIVNALNVGANTITGTTGVIDFTDFDVSADGVVTLAPDGGPADVILISPSAATTDGLDVSDVDLVNALNIGANRITSNSTATGPFEWDGVGQLVIGTGGGGGGGVGTGVFSFRGGGVIDSTNDGDIQIAPQDAGMVIFPSGTTVRFPQASPEEDRNGLYWDNAGVNLCIDDDSGTDVCIALTLAAFQLEEADKRALLGLLSNKEGFERLSSIVSDTEKIDQLSLLSNAAMSEKTMDALKALENLSDEDLERFKTLAADLDQAGAVLQKEGYLYAVIKDALNQERISFVETASEPYLFDRGSAQLENGELYIEFDENFIKMAGLGLEDSVYMVQLTPTSVEIQGVLIAEKSQYGFTVKDSGGLSETTFDWEVAARSPKALSEKFPAKSTFENQ